MSKCYKVLAIFDFLLTFNICPQVIERLFSPHSQIKTLDVCNGPKICKTQPDN